MKIKRIMSGRVFAAGFMAALLISAVITGAGSQAVYANSNEDKKNKEAVKEEKPNGTPFSVPGNAELLDDVSGDDSKQFITVRTKNNQTFFVVIDRQNSMDNVYMLSMIDENDLLEFLKDGNDKKLINIPEKDKVEETADKGVVDKKEEEKTVEKSDSSMGGLLVAIGIILMIVGGYYILRIRPKRQHSPEKSSEDDSDELEEDFEDEYEDYDEVEDDREVDEKGVYDNESEEMPEEDADNTSDDYYEEEEMREKNRPRRRRKRGQ